MISSYCFSLVGRDHIKTHMSCHDSSLIKAISSSWKIAVVADGVGSCKHAEIASEIAVKEVAELIKKQFPPSSSDERAYFSVIHAAMHGAANAIESYVEEKDPGNEMEYQTTLAVAIMSSKNLYYGSAGDSGIIALDDQGNYHLVTKKQNDELGRVYSIPTNRLFEIGRANYIPAAVLCMTDGIYDTIAPVALRNNKFPVNVPFANMFVTYAFGLEKFKESEAVESCKNHLIKYLQSDECKNMTDDLSVAALINTNSDLQPEDIKWEEPQIDFYALKWNEVSLYPSIETRNKIFKHYIREKNPDWSETQVDELLKKYSESNSSSSDSEVKRELKSESSLKENQEKKRNASIPETQLELDKEMIGKNTRGIRGFWKKRS